MKTVLANADEKMQKTLNVMKSEFASIRAGRANPEVLNKITVDYYGTQTPINQVAAVSVAEARILPLFPRSIHSVFPVHAGTFPLRNRGHPPARHT